jgi:mycothiol synthase
MTPSPPIEDVRAILTIAARAEEEDGAAPLDEATTLALRAGAVDAHLVHGGFTLLRDGELTLVVDPPERGAGLGRQLLGRVLASYDGPLAAWSHGNHPAAARLAEDHDFARVRDLWVMRRRASEPLPVAKAIPGVTVRGFEEADTEALLAVNAASFAAHPEQGAMDATDFAARTAEPWFDPAGLLVAVDDDGRLVGFHWTKRHSRDVGEVYVVGVSPEAQGRGLGKALTLAGLHHLDAKRVEEVILYVESDNAAAIALYSGLGFTHADADTHVMYRRG